MDVRSRADRVRGAMDRAQLDALVLSAPSNVRWLTGFTGSSGTALITDDTLVLLTDGRYAEQGPAELAAAGVDGKVVIGADSLAGLVAATAGHTRVGLEAEHVTWADQRRYHEAIEGELVPTSGLLGNLRAVKDSGELARIRVAVQIADDTLAEVIPMLAHAPTEREVALELDFGMRRHGATASAYETIVASGPNSALPHARPTDRTLQPGDLVVIDVGALVDGYRSDMTRSFVLGEPDHEQLRQLEVVRQSQAAGVAAVGPGVAAKVVDKACRDVIATAGWQKAFTHGTGHGVGLDIHEQPRVNARTADVLAPGMVVTVEPGVYIVGQGGVRWEDLLHVTDTGAEVLTSSPKNPVLR